MDIGAASPLLLPFLCLAPPANDPPALPAWFVPLISLASALFVALANYLIQRWRYRIDRISEAVDHLCTEINLAADASTRYWLLDTTQNDQAKQAKELEPELVGRQMRLQSLLVALRTLDPALKLDETEQQLTALFDTISGDDFRVSGRQQNPEKAQLVQSQAAQLNGELTTTAGRRSKSYF